MRNAKSLRRGAARLLGCGILLALHPRLCADEGPSPIVTANRPADVEPPGDAVASWMNQAVGVGQPSTLRRGDAAPHQVVPRNRSAGKATAGPQALDVLWPLAAVLALVAGGAWVCKQWLPRSASAGTRGGIDVLARQHLSSKQSLCLVRVGRRLVLIGVTPDRIASLAQIDDADEAAAVVSAVQLARPGSFSSVFNRFTSREAAKVREEPHEAAAGAAVPQVSEAGQQLRGLLGRVRVLGKGAAAPKPA